MEQQKAVASLMAQACEGCRLSAASAATRLGHNSMEVVCCRVSGDGPKGPLADCPNSAQKMMKCQEPPDNYNYQEISR